MDRVVFDTVVFVRGLINPHSSWGRLIFAHAASYTLVVSPGIVKEVIEVIHRPELVRKFRTLPGRDIETVLQIISHAEAVAVSDTPAVSRDMKDDVFLATAKAGQAMYLVSEDRDRLDIGAYEGITIIPAAAFLTLLED